MIAALRGFLQKRIPANREKPAVEAYDAWSASYDQQPGNLMLDLDKELFTKLVEPLQLAGSKIADIGCGTGRHWHQLYAAKPSLVIGFDVSAGMLQQLKHKFPDAMTQLITDDLLSAVPDAFIDCVISTLTIAHIKNIGAAIAAWARITKTGGDLIVTDFHPALLARGGKRSFHYQGKSLSVVNYVHSLKKLEELFIHHGYSIVRREERYVDSTVKHYYAAQNALPVYERYEGIQVIYGWHLKKTDAAE